MNQETLFAAALGINTPWKIKAISFSEEKKRLDIDIDFISGSKFTLEGASGAFKVHDTVKKTWRHLNFFDHECYLNCKVPRIIDSTGNIKLVKPPWGGLTKGFTLLFEAFALQLVTVMPVLTASRFLNVSDDKLWRLIEKYVVTARAKENYSNVKAIGVDETSRKKGHNYITLFADLDKRKSVFITEGKDSNVFPCFILDLASHDGKVANIERISMDMSKAFIKGQQKYMPDAEVTFDKFHIIKVLNSAVDEVRREEVKEQPILKNARYAVLKNEENLTPKQKEKKEQIEKKGYRTKTYRAMKLREYFQEAYHAKTLAEFEEHLIDWYKWAIRSRLDPIKDFARTVKRHWQGITNWAKYRDTNAILEGLNSLIQAAKSKARGYRSSSRLIWISYLVTAKLDFAKVNKKFEPLTTH